jgi:hypothetical protein
MLPALLALGLVLLLPLGLSAFLAWRGLPVGRPCPRCGADTALLDAGPFARLARRIRLPVQYRWCLFCGWEGSTRRLRRVAPTGPVRIVAGAGAVTRIMDVRRLELDGIAWRVRLECWDQTGVCYGRLVFVEPSGRLWLDARPLAGRSDRDLLGQALALPDDLLALRLRELVSD